MQGSEKHICMLTKQPEYLDVPPTAGFCTYLMCKIRELTLPAMWHHGTLLYIRSLKSLKMERDRQLDSGYWLIWHPYSPVKLYWDCFHMILTFVVFVYLPFQVFVTCPRPYDLFILATDVLSFLCLCSNLITGYVDEEKRIVLEPQKIARHYIRSTFTMDFIGVLPLQFLEPFNDCEYPSHTVMFLFKLFRLRTLNLQWCSLLRQCGLSYVKKLALSVLVQLLLFFHWMTYLHYQIPAFCVHFYDMDEALVSWMERFTHGNNAITKYITNLYLVSGLCVGAGYYDHTIALVPQMILSSTLALTGLCFLVYAFSTFLRLMMYRHYGSYLFNGRHYELEKYMNLLGLPLYLQKKIQLYLNYTFNCDYFNVQYIMETINEQIKQDINMHSCKALVMNVPLFHDMPVSLINTIIFSLERQMYMPGEVVVKCGEPGRSIHLISHGTVAVINSEGREVRVWNSRAIQPMDVAHLRDGSYFGETALLHPGKMRKATIIAIEVTEMFLLRSEQFYTCLQPYSHLKRRLEDISATVRTKTRRANQRFT